MRIFAIGDLHLSFGTDKPMDVFGEEWIRHADKIKRSWQNNVTADDWVLIPGDVSWAMNEQEVTPDLAFIGKLPGSKVLLRGNHDYWWSTITKVRSLLPPKTYALQNDAMAIGSVAIAGTRGWLLPTYTGFTSEDDKIYKRELKRLELSLKAAESFQQPIWVMLHYPPLTPSATTSDFEKLMREYNVERCIYGHLHGEGHRHAVQGWVGGIFHELVSADHLHFAPKLLT